MKLVPQISTVFKMSDKNQLDALIRRKKELTRQRDNLIRHKTTDVARGSLSTSSDVIEDSDTDLPTPMYSTAVLSHRNVTIPSTDDEMENEDINTSTICLPRTHNFFQAYTESSSANRSAPSTSDQSHAPKITVLSEVIIKQSGCETLKSYANLMGGNIMQSEVFVDEQVNEEIITTQFIAEDDISKIRDVAHYKLAYTENSSANRSAPYTSDQSHLPKITVLSEVIIKKSDCETLKSYADLMGDNIMQSEVLIAEQVNEEIDMTQFIAEGDISKSRDDPHYKTALTEEKINHDKFANDQTYLALGEHSTSPLCEFTTIEVPFAESYNEEKTDSDVSLSVLPPNTSNFTHFTEFKTHCNDNMTNKDECNISTERIGNFTIVHNSDQDSQRISSTLISESDSPKTHKTRLTSQFKKTYMDFMLDEDIGDFSCGSSDLWSPKDSEFDSSSGTQKKTKTKTKKKENIVLPIRKKKPVNKKKKRAVCRQAGLDYDTTSGKIKDAREIKENPCKIGKCPRKCYEITEERRQSLFNFFWKLDSQRKKEWIVNCATHISIKRKRTDSDNSRRNQTVEYYINEGEGKKQVCQQFITSTLCISQTYILYNLSHSEEGIAHPEKRTRHAVNKFDEPTYTIAKEYIEKLPVLPSHYSRKNSNKLYLPQEFKNVSNLYRLYVKYCEKKSQVSLSERLFRNLFNEYNISFHIPKKDKCKYCIKYENNTNVMSEKETNEFLRHTEEKKACYKRCEIHRNILYKDNSIIVASFDLQKVLNTPHGESMLLYYSRKYAVYNLTVYESNTQNGFCYTWGESDAKRGSSEIGTCLFNYLVEIDKRGAKYVILYCDSCGGQNKNRVILSIFKYFLEKSQNLQVIQVNYLLPGHTYMAVDSMHSVIEREVRKLIVWSPKQWATFMLTARKTPRPYEVKVMDHTDFIDWKSVTEKVFTAKTVANKDLKLRDMRIVTFKKNKLNAMEVKYTMKENGQNYDIELGQETKSVKGKGWGKGRSNERIMDTNLVTQTELPRLYTRPLPISTKKYQDLKKLCDDGVIPKQFVQDYLTLPHINKNDTLKINHSDDSESEIEENVINSENEDEQISSNKSKQPIEDTPVDYLKKQKRVKLMEPQKTKEEYKPKQIMKKKIQIKCEDQKKSKKIEIKSDENTKLQNRIIQVKCEDLKKSGKKQTESTKKRECEVKWKAGKGKQQLEKEENSIKSRRSQRINKGKKKTDYQ